MDSESTCAVPGARYAALMALAMLSACVATPRPVEDYGPGAYQDQIQSANSPAGAAIGANEYPLMPADIISLT
ncbi:MAG: hypothetical protein ACK5NN_08265, partial [Sphingomonadaceae bacterium]